MKTFLEFILEAKNSDKKGFFINDKGEAVPSKPIIFKPNKTKKKSKKNLKEKDVKSSSTPLTDLPGQKSDRDEHEKHMEGISKTLHSKQPKPSRTEVNHIKSYTEGEEGSGFHSYPINQQLIDNHKEGKPATHGMERYHKNIHNTISKLASHPLGHEVHLYSGTGFDPQKAASESKNGIIHTPAHISTTHDIHTAATFSGISSAWNEGNKAHIMHIHAKASDKGFHIGKRTANPGEHETVIPAGTKLKYSHTTMHNDGYNDTEYHVHHFTIHHQE